MIEFISKYKSGYESLFVNNKNKSKSMLSTVFTNRANCNDNNKFLHLKDETVKFMIPGGKE